MGHVGCCDDLPSSLLLQNNIRNTCIYVSNPLCYVLLDFFIGRYNKYSRELSQTPWIIEGVRKSELSVEEIINKPIRQAFRYTGRNRHCNWT